MDQIQIAGEPYYTVRDTLKRTWRGGGNSPFAAGRYWECQITCVSQAELEAFDYSINFGAVSVVLPDGEAIQATVNRSEHYPFANTVVIALNIQEVKP